ncbi:hypothetical protein [Duganella sp. Leaf126]|uniref:hypothetical protein n=1 Tax=Duganella sp. Leaf126 TaxID=1736266 RepID=UPI000A8D809F|nr:hypothetical protein [Duganella sp. Leaf126]
MSSEIYSCLIISPDFFGYSEEIKTALARRGINAMLVDDRPAADTLTKALIRISPRILRGKAEAYFEAVTERARSHPITDVLVIKGQALSCEAIRRLRLALPDARFTLYFWDSYKNMSSDSPTKVGLFDRAFTFDPVDAQNDVRLKYRPLFCLDEYFRLPPTKTDIDLFFFGTIHSDRYQVLSRMQSSVPNGMTFKKIMYFSSRLVYMGRRILQPAFWTAKRAEFIFKPVFKDELKMLLARSRIVVDIERPIQTGLTMRTLEAVGARKKIITTNAFATKTDFYRPENVLVIDRENIRIPREFLESEFCELPQEVIEKYTLNGWLDEVLPLRALA